ncbi:MAG TPA: hypothetical protein VJ549_05545 [Geothrix sp.]|nr:hypothetical protein [Geothrix sp.]
MNTRILLGLTLGAAAVWAAEPQAWNWPKVVLIGIEEMKPGKGMAHQKNETAWTRALAAAKFPYHFYAMTPVAGPNQVWWVNPVGTFADLEKAEAFIGKNPALKAQVEGFAVKDGDLVNTSKSELYVLRPDLSRSPGTLYPHFYWTFVIRVKPGHEADFATIGKKMAAFYDKAGLEARWGIYQGMAGTVNPTFLVVVPLRALADLDKAMEEERKFAEAAGEEGLKSMAKLSAEATGREEALLLGVDPKMSYPDEGDLKSDPEFWKEWTAKPAAKAKPAKAEPK